MYNIFNNVISNTTAIDSNIRSIVQEETLTIMNKVNTALNIKSSLKIENLNEFNGVYIEIGKYKIVNNKFQSGDQNLYVLKKDDFLYYSICFVDGIGWNFINFNTDPSYFLNIPIDLSDFIMIINFITNETRYFGASSYPKNLNISYI
jgi:hypothetical protein